VAFANRDKSRRFIAEVHMIDAFTEKIILLTKAAKRLPAIYRENPPHAATLYRWASRGVRGIRLEIIRVGGRTCTSEEALARFFERLSQDPRSVAISVPDASRRTLREAELKQAGFLKQKPRENTQRQG
jgi:hypothetical protein